MENSSQLSLASIQGRRDASVVGVLGLCDNLSRSPVPRPQDVDFEADELLEQVFEVLIEDFESAQSDLFIVIDFQLGTQRETSFIAKVSGVKHNTDCAG